MNVYITAISASTHCRHFRVWRLQIWNRRERFFT